jgi:hypothetical protein
LCPATFATLTLGHLLRCFFAILGFRLLVEVRSLESDGAIDGALGEGVQLGDEVFDVGDLGVDALDAFIEVAGVTRRCVLGRQSFVALLAEFDELLRPTIQLLGDDRVGVVGDGVSVGAILGVGDLEFVTSREQIVASLHEREREIHLAVARAPAHFRVRLDDARHGVVREGSDHLVRFLPLGRGEGVAQAVPHLPPFYLLPVEGDAAGEEGDEKDRERFANVAKHGNPPWGSLGLE